LRGRPRRSELRRDRCDLGKLGMELPDVALCWSGWPLTTWEHLEAAVARLDARIDEVIAPYLCGDPRSTGIG
jgi:hypothetical protein